MYLNGYCDSGVVLCILRVSVQWNCATWGGGSQFLTSLEIQKSVPFADIGYRVPNSKFDIFYAGIFWVR